MLRHVGELNSSSGDAETSTADKHIFYFSWMLEHNTAVCHSAGCAGQEAAYGNTIKHRVHFQNKQ